jgi:hypothetical protein
MAPILHGSATPVTRWDRIQYEYMHATMMGRSTERPLKTTAGALVYYMIAV